MDGCNFESLKDFKVKIKYGEAQDLIDNIKKELSTLESGVEQLNAFTLNPQGWQSDYANTFQGKINAFKKDITMSLNKIRKLYTLVDKTMEEYEYIDSKKSAGIGD